MAGVVLAWVDVTRADSPEQGSVPQQALAKHRLQEDACTYLGRHHWSTGACIETWALRKPCVCRSNHVVGGPSDDDASGGPSLFADGSAGREHANHLYGEGKKSFHRLQLEIIRASNDQSIFAWNWNVRTGSILADDPSCFQYCGRMELMGHDEFIQYIKEDVPEEELDSVEDRLGTFPITKSRNPKLAAPPSLSQLSHTLQSLSAVPPWSIGSTSGHRFGFVGVQLL